MGSSHPVPCRVSSWPIQGHHRPGWPRVPELPGVLESSAQRSGGRVAERGRA